MFLENHLFHADCQNSLLKSSKSTICDSFNFLYICCCLSFLFLIFCISEFFPFPLLIKLSNVISVLLVWQKKKSTFVYTYQFWFLFLCLLINSCMLWSLFLLCSLRWFYFYFLTSWEVIFVIHFSSRTILVTFHRLSYMVFSFFP